MPASVTDAFDDDDGVHEVAVNRLAALGIVDRTGPRTYGSDLPLTRAQLAALAVRIDEHVNGIAPAAAPDHFTDDDGHALEPAINIAADLGIVLGTVRAAWPRTLPSAGTDRQHPPPPVRRAVGDAQLLNHLSASGSSAGGDPELPVGASNRLSTVA